MIAKLLSIISFIIIFFVLQNLSIKSKKSCYIFEQKFNIDYYSKYGFDSFLLISELIKLFMTFHLGLVHIKILILLLIFAIEVIIFSI